jgi:hypothetical protein
LDDGGNYFEKTLRKLKTQPKVPIFKQIQDQVDLQKLRSDRLLALRIWTPVPGVVWIARRS